MLSMQGWQVSEVLGLAWSDLDLDAKEPTATVGRAVVQVPGASRVLGPPKRGAEGIHYLLPGVVDRLRAHRSAQAADRLAVGRPGRLRYTTANGSTSCSRPKSAESSPANTSTS